MSNLETIERLYEAFGSGDIPTVLGMVAEEAAWEHWNDNSAQAAGVPWFKARSGPGGVAEFFESLSVMEINDFQVLNLMEGPNQIAATIKMDFTVTATGERVTDEEIHLWTFDDSGKISGMRHYTDTAKHIKAATGSPAGVN